MLLRRAGSGRRKSEDMKGGSGCLQQFGFRHCTQLPLEVELEGASRRVEAEGRKFEELAGAGKILEGARAKLALRVDTLSRQCGHLEDLNKVLVAENSVCIAMLGQRNTN